MHTHVCPLGMRCACVPLHWDDALVGMLKLVAGADMSMRHFRAAARVLGLVVSGVSQESAAARVSEEVSALTEPREAGWTGAHDATARGGAQSEDSVAVERHERGRLVEAALSYLDRHYQAADLCLLSVARALGCNPRYLTTRFTRVVGERMHPHLLGLRVAHASRLLIETGMPVKEVAFASGFRDSTSLARAFRRRVGTSPGQYRRVFSG